MSLRHNTQRPQKPLSGLNDPAEHFKNPAQVDYLRALVKGVQDGMAGVVTQNAATPSIMLQSPNGKVHKVTVGDDGQITAEYIQG